MPIVFELKSKPNLPLDVRAVAPERISSMSIDQIGKLEIGFGNRTTQVSRWFEVSGSADDQKVVFAGPLENVHSIGHSIHSGMIEVRGSAGRHVGASMSGGEIVVRGNVSDYLGYEMQGGTIAVHGDAADHVGGCYPGAKYGMNRGTILIAGSAGKGLGYRMRRGTIVVAGDAGEHVAWQMRAGTIMICGNCVGSPGVDMRRGTVLLGRETQLNATFSKGAASAMPAIEILLQWIEGICKKHEIAIAATNSNRYQMCNGDTLCGGRGEIFWPIA